MGYITKQSARIMKCLKDNHEKHLTAEDVYLILKQNNVAVGKTTVYRHLEKLYSDGVIRKFLSGDGDSACFQYSENSDECHYHYHLKCTSCNTLFHTECDYLNELSKHILSEHNFIVDGSKTVIYGICDECSKKGSYQKGNE